MTPLDRAIEPGSVHPKIGMKLLRRKRAFQLPVRLSQLNISESYSLLIPTVIATLDRRFKAVNLEDLDSEDELRAL